MESSTDFEAGSVGLTVGSSPMNSERELQTIGIGADEVLIIAGRPGSDVYSKNEI